MAPQPTAAVAQAPGPQRARAEDTKWGIGNMLRLLAVVWLIKSFFSGSSATPKNAIRTDYYWPKFNKSESVDFFLFGSDSSRFTDVSDTSKLIWTETNVPLAANSDLTHEYTYRPSKVLLPASELCAWHPQACLHIFWLCMQDVQNNGTFYLYAYVVRSGKPLDRKDPAFDPDSVAVKQHRTYPQARLSST